MPAALGCQRSFSVCETSANFLCICAFGMACPSVSQDPVCLGTDSGPLRRKIGRMLDSRTGPHWLRAVHGVKAV